MIRQIAFLSGLSLLQAQSPPAPAFEAATIRPAAASRNGGGGLNRQPARIRVINSSLKFCIQMAWNVQSFQISGGPAWAETDLFDMEAVAAKPFQEDEDRAMLQTLLANRFGLVIHRETQTRPGYALVVARNGPKLPPPVEDRNIFFSTTASGDITLKARDASLHQLARALSSRLGAIILDRTGISGNFDVSLQYAPETGDHAAPSLFTALQETLGLKLEAQKVPVEVIVIDRAIRPSAN